MKFPFANFRLIISALFALIWTNLANVPIFVQQGE